MPPLQQLVAESLSLSERGVALLPLLKLNSVKNQGPVNCVFESLPCVQEWVATCARNKMLTSAHAVLEIVKKKPLWLSAATRELQFMVPVGQMSRSTWELSIAMIHCIGKQPIPNCDTLAVDLLKRMINEEDCSRFKVTSILYTSVMRAAPAAAEELFESMTKRHKQNSLRCAPSVSNRVALVVAITKTGHRHRALHFLWRDAPVSLFNFLINSFESPSDADKLLSRMEDNLRTGRGTFPNLRSFRIVLEKWVAIDPGKAQDILERVVFWGKSVPMLHATVDFFVDVMRAQTNNVERVENLMEQVQLHILSTPVSMHSWPGYTLSPALFEVCMTAWSEKGCPERVEKVLSDMERKSVKPSKLCYALVARSWSSVGNIEGVERTIRRAGASADVKLCNVVLHELSRADAIQGQAFFETMCDMPCRMQPDATSYRILFEAWTTSNSEQAGDHATALLRRMHRHVKEGKIEMKADIYKLASGFLYKSRQKDQKVRLRRTGKIDRKELANGADAETSPYSARRLAEDIFKRMEHAQVKPTTASFTCILAALNRSGETTPSIKTFSPLEEGPDVVSCNSVLAICLSSPSPRTSQVSRSMISHMMREYSAGNKQMLPTPSTLTRLFGRLNIERSGIQADASAAIMEGRKFPDLTFALACFTYALTLCSLSHDNKTPECADHLWQNFRIPSLECFNLVLKCFANHPRHDVSQKAEAYLLTNDNRSDWKPNAESFNLVVEAVAKSRRPDAAERAVALLNRLQSQITSPGCLSLVLLACAMAPLDENADRLKNFNLAVRAFSNWKEIGKVVNSLHYHSLLTCAIRLAPSSKARITMAKGVFDECLAAGMVDKFILKRFWGIAPENMRQELLGRNVREASVTDLPSAWTCRVSPRRSPRKLPRELPHSSVRKLHL